MTSRRKNSAPHGHRSGAIITNYLLFNHTYLRRLQTDSSVDEQASLAAQGVRDWYGFRDYSSIQSMVDSWVGPLLNSFELELRPLDSGDNRVHLLYTAWDHEAPVGLCYITPPGANLDTTTKGQHWMAQAVLAARKWKPAAVSAEEGEAEDQEKQALRWVVMTNGNQWRLLDAQALRRYEAYLQVDLERLVQDPSDLSALRVFYRCFHRSAFERDTEGRFGLDWLLDESNQATKKAEDHLKACVSANEGAMARLCLGLVEATGKDRFTEDERDAIYRDATYLLYRMLFILYAEARDLLPMDNTAYQKASLTSLVEIAYAYRQQGIPNAQATTLWLQLKRLFNAIYESDPDLGIPAYNGGLFDDGDKPHLRAGTIAVGHLTQALFDLAYQPDGAAEDGYRLIDYRDLSVRHLGSIYEGMIEYRLQIAEETLWARRDGKGNVRFLQTGQDGAPRRNDVEIKKGDVYFSQSPGERRATGTYYTPEYIVDHIVQQTVLHGLKERRASLEEKLRGWHREIAAALSPDERVRMQRTADEELLRFIEEQVLTFRVCDPAMGSGHFLVNASHQMTAFTIETLHLTSWESTEIEADLVALRRRVVERCLYGVDLSLMAVELAKLSLWLASVAEGKPLSFLDHHLRQGNSLIGSKLEDVVGALAESSPVRTSHGERKAREAGQLTMLDHPAFRQHVMAAADLLTQISTRVSETVDDVRAQEASYERVQNELRPYASVADLLTACHFGVVVDRQRLQQICKHLIDRPVAPVPVYERLLAQTQGLVENRYFLHWMLEFPEVFFGEHTALLGEQSGFHAVISNPPYGDILADIEKQFLYDSGFGSGGSGNNDIFRFFVERGVFLLAPGGLLGFIIPNTCLGGAKYSNYRIRISEIAKILSILDFKTHRHFEVDVFTHIFLLEAEKPLDEYSTVYRKSVAGSVSDYEASQLRIAAGSSETWLPKGTIYEKLKKHPRVTPLSAICESADVGINYQRHNVGWQSRQRSKIAERIFYEGQREHPQDVEYLKGEDIKRYVVQVRTHKWLRHDYDSLVGEGESVSVNHQWARKPSKILTRQTADRIIAALDRERYYTGRSLHSSDVLAPGYSELFVLAVLNSTFISYYYNLLAREKGRALAQVKLKNVRQLPIPRISFTDDDARRLALERGQHLHTVCTDNDNQDCAIRFVDDQLGQKPERSDVIHDLLAYLAQQMIDLQRERQSLAGKANLLRFVAQDSPCLRLGKALGGSLSSAAMVDNLSVVRHDIEGLRLSREENGRWFLEVRAKLRNPATGWREYQRDQDGNITREWLPAYRLPLDEATGRFFHYALANLDGFDGAGKFPGGYTRTTLEKLKATKVPKFVPVDLTPLAALEARLAKVRCKIQLTDNLIDQIVYRLYGLTEEEIATVEGWA